MMDAAVQAVLDRLKTCIAGARQQITALWLGEAARAVGGHVIGMEYVAAKPAQAVQPHR